MKNDDDTIEASSMQGVDGRRGRTEDTEPEKWVVVVVMGKDWGDMMRGLRDQATQLHIDAERSGAPSTWGISGRYAYWSGVGGRPSLERTNDVQISEWWVKAWTRAVWRWHRKMARWKSGVVPLAHRQETFLPGEEKRFGKAYSRYRRALERGVVERTEPPNAKLCGGGPEGGSNAR